MKFNTNIFVRVFG